MTFFKNSLKHIAFSVLSVLGGVTLGAGLVAASTTISTNIQTGGTLSVTGNASTTMLSAYTAYFGGAATTTISSAGAVTMLGTLNVTGLTTLGAASLQGATSTSLAVMGSSTVSSVLNVGSTLNANGNTSVGGTLTYGGVTLSNAVTGTGNMVLSASPTFTGTAIMSGATLSGLASTTQLKVGSDQVSTVSGMIFGFCTIAGTSLTASTTTQVTCAGATGVTTSYRVFVQATSSLPTPLVIQSATSSTGAIEVNIYDSGIATTTTINISPTSLNFWAVR